MGEKETDDKTPKAPPIDLSIQQAFGALNVEDETLGESLFDLEGQHVRYHFYPTWRAQFGHLILYLVCVVLAVRVSTWWPASVIEGELFTIDNVQYMLHLPLAIFIPAIILGKIFLYIYDAKYIIDERGVEAQVGLVSLSLRQPRLRYEDIRGVEPRQTLWERILGIGSVLIGSAMTDDVEITMAGVPNPRAIQLLINSERDKRMKLVEKNISSRAEKDIIFGD